MSDTGNRINEGVEYALVTYGLFYIFMLCIIFYPSLVISVGVHDFIIENGPGHTMSNTFINSYGQEEDYDTQISGSRKQIAITTSVILFLVGSFLITICVLFTEKWKKRIRILYIITFWPFYKMVYWLMWTCNIDPWAYDRGWPGLDWLPFF